MAATSINCLAVVLKELGWSYTRLIAELRRQAAIDGIVLPKTESMVALISRWVNNHQQPDDFYRDLLSRATGRARAELFGDEPVALAALPSGLVVPRPVDGLPTTGELPVSSGGDGLIAWLGQQEPELKDRSVERRSFLANLALLGVDLTALVPASSAQAGSVGERALTVDGALLRDLDLTTGAYERMRHRVPGRHLMRQVVGHIELTEDALRGSLWPAQKQRLLANLSQTTSLLSWLQFFDQGDRAAARTWLMRSTRAAQESGDPELMVLAMIRGAEQQTYSGHAEQSTQLLDAAERLAARGSSPKALSWILAANAEAHATLGELDPSLALLDRSLDALRPGRAGDDPSWAEYWNRSKVLGYVGACHMRMRRPKAARAALDDALHLGEELTVKHQSIYLVDLATTYTQEREPEEACRLAGKALDIAGPMHYSTTMERMTALRRDLDAWNSEACVQQLDERLHAVANAENERP
jgi:tetratricopeptide (TPR) repeat protein